MNQQTELEKAKVWIRALAAKMTDRRCSAAEAEALAAAKKVGELLEVYELSMGEVELGGGTLSPVVGRRPCGRRLGRGDGLGLARLSHGAGQRGR